MTKRLQAALAAGALALMLFVLSGPRAAQPGAQLGHGGPLESLDYDMLGTPGRPVTLAATYASSTSGSFLTGGMPNFVIGGTYTPKSYGSNAFLLLEISIDGGQTYLPYVTVTPESGDVLVNSSGTSGTNGTPFVIPGNALGTAASGTAMSFSIPLSVASDYVRVKAKEYTTSTAGTLNVQSLFTSN